jgi:hypothetical protein
MPAKPEREKADCPKLAKARKKTEGSDLRSDLYGLPFLLAIFSKSFTIC